MDRLVLPQQNGNLQVTSRLARPFPGFPVNLNADLASELFVDEPKQQLIALNTQGVLHTIDLNGRILQQTACLQQNK